MSRAIDDGGIHVGHAILSRAQNAGENSESKIQRAAAHIAQQGHRLR